MQVERESNTLKHFLDLQEQENLENSTKRIVMLNADVMNGPGMRWEEGLALNGDTYTSECLSTMVS